MTKFWVLHKKTIINGLLVTGIVLCLIIANLLSKFIIPSDLSSSSVSSSSYELHLISLSKSKVENESKERARDFQALGAGGFIWKQDDYFYVISSAYLNKNDAALVQNSIKLNHNLESQILTIKFSPYTIYGNFDSEQTKVLDKLLSACFDIYTSVYDVVISLDTGVSNETSARLAINAAQNNLAKAVANFNTLFPAPVPDNLSPLKDMIDRVFTVGQKLSASEAINDSQTYSSIIKYRYLEILNIFYQFTN